ncbi:hypothetical protein [Aliidiomarina celeris]|uniref:hypothetical protein n=1 Tax=Aliidiomarina celeris TaxID=2249428 RepID=UPI000DE80EA8|nr:hypothetical protein [Aliidiomarina celeris]
MKIITTFLLLTFSISALSQDGEIDDPFDVSERQSEIEELGVVKQPAVDALEERSRELFNSGDCVAAVPVLDEYARKSNALANVIAQTLEPYYSASYDDRQDFPTSRLQPLIPLESLANSYKQKRNIAYAMQGECLLKLGREEEALPILSRALDLIDIDNETWWVRTRNNLLQVVGVEVE